MGLNGAFLTGDLFNLFVFFEVLLAASYGLRPARIGHARASRRACTTSSINLAASLLFLIGVSLIYGVTGTLNMADLATRIPAHLRREPGAAGGRRGHPRHRLPGQGGRCGRCASGCPATYAAAAAAGRRHVCDHDQGRRLCRAAPVAAAVRRGRPARRRSSAADWLLVGGMVTIAFGVIGVLASQDWRGLPASSVLVSSGTLLAAIGMATGRRHRWGAVLPGQLDARDRRLLPADRTRRTGPRAGRRRARRHARSLGRGGRTTTWRREVGIAIPGTMAILGAASSAARCCSPACRRCPASSPSSRCSPPSLNPAGHGATAGIPASAWALLGAPDPVRPGGAHRHDARRHPHASGRRSTRTVPRVRVIEIAPVVVLLLATRDLTVQAGPVMRYMRGDGAAPCTRRALHRERPAARRRITAPRRAAHETRLLPFPLLTAALLAHVAAAQPRSRSARSCSAASCARRRLGDDARCEPAEATDPAAAARSCALALLGLWSTSCAPTSPSPGSILGPGSRERTSGFVIIPLDLRDPLRAWRCWPASSPATPGTLWVEFDPATGMLMIHVLDLIDETRVDRDHQEPLRTPAAGDLRMSATILTWSLAVAQIVSGACHGMRRLSACSAGRGRRTGSLGLDALYVNAMLLVLTFGIRTGSTLLFRGRAGHRPARLRRHAGARQVPHARRGDRMTSRSGSAGLGRAADRVASAARPRPDPDRGRSACCGSELLRARPRPHPRDDARHRLRSDRVHDSTSRSCSPGLWCMRFSSPFSYGDHAGHLDGAGAGGIASGPVGGKSAPGGQFCGCERFGRQGPRRQSPSNQREKRRWS